MSTIAKDYEFFSNLEVAIEVKGLEINILLRLSPIIPNVILNYGLPSLGNIIA
jgi:uncharacterized membrane protein YdjX (TVP38/TMEM64 family)